MYRIAAEFVLLLFLIFPITCAKENENTTGIDQNRKNAVRKFMKDNDVKGMAVAIFNEREVLWREQAGVTTYGKPLDSKTLFSIQSISKNITAVAVLIAAQKGIVSLDTPVIQYLPDFSVHSCLEEHPERIVTLRHLLTHTAGLTHEAPTGNNYDFTFSSHDEHLKSIQETWLKFPVGTRYAYSNLGYDLAAAVIQNANRTAFHEYLKQFVFSPLGMERTTTDDAVFVNDANKTEGVITSVCVKHYPIPFTGSGAVYSTLDDMIRLTQFHLNFGKVNGIQVLDSAYLLQMYTPVITPDYGMGTAVIRDSQYIALNHNGSGFGYGASMLWYPEYQIGCVILTNAPCYPYPLAKQLTEDYIRESAIEKTDSEFLKNLPHISGDEPAPLSDLPAFADSLYRDEWLPFCGDYSYIFSGMDFKWYAKLAFFFGHKPVRLKVYRDDTRLMMTIRRGDDTYTSRLFLCRKGLFFTEHGEALDFRHSPPTYRNIKLKKS